MEKKDFDDIFLGMKDGTRLVAQAKSSEKGEELVSACHLTDAKDGTKNLLDNYSSGTTSMVFIFNYHKPFGAVTQFNSSVVSDQKPFDNLEESDKKELEDFVSSNANKDKISSITYSYLHYEGNDKNSRQSYLIQYFKENAASVFQTFSGDISVPNILDKWVEIIANSGCNSDDLPAGILSGVILLDGLKAFHPSTEISNYPAINFSNGEKQVLDQKFQDFLGKDDFSFEDLNDIYRLYLSFTNNQNLPSDKPSSLNRYFQSLSKKDLPSFWDKIGFTEEQKAKDYDVHFFEMVIAFLAQKNTLIDAVEEEFGS